MTNKCITIFTAVVLSATVHCTYGMEEGHAKKPVVLISAAAWRAKYGTSHGQTNGLDAWNPRGVGPGMFDDSIFMPDRPIAGFQIDTYQHHPPELTVWRVNENRLLSNHHHANSIL